MSSWSSTAQPYPPRDRSRSPSRGTYGRAPLPEPGYPEGYRADWDPYDRERWGYERGFEGRRSPEDEVGRKRRRSTSPFDRGDRYDPRPRYNDDYDAHSRGYGYGSPPRRGGGSYPGRRAPVDPWTMDYPATLKQYADWFRYFFPQEAMEEDNADKAATQEAGDGSKPRNGIKSRWEKYKKEYAQKQLQTMFEHHRKSPWFAEKYDPSSEFEQLRKRVRKEGLRGRIDIFLDELDAGAYDPKTESENEAVAKDEANTTETSDPNENSTDVKDDSKPSGDDDMAFNMDAEEEANDPDSNRAEGNGKGSDNRRGNKDDNRGEEVSVMPETNTVMIRTIPPDIGRVKLEQSCGIIPGFMYLALGEPMQKRNYYRAGWIRFKDDADMPSVMTELAERKIEGFKLHVTHALRPFVNRARYTPEVASRPERLLKDLANAKALANKFEEEATTLRVTKFAKPKAETAETDETKPADTDTDTLMEDNQDDEEEPEPRQSGVFAIEQRVEKILDELRENGASSDVLEEKKTVIALDLYIAYLRAAFHTCYYCSIVTNHLEELQRRCVRHGRKPLTKSMLEEIKAVASSEREDKEMKDLEDGVEVKDDKDESNKDDKDKGNSDKRGGDKRDWKRNDERWLEWLDSKIALLLDRDNVDPREYGGKVYDEELSKVVEPFIKQEDEGKFRCKTCQKLFKATSFVEKHIVNKHPELVKPLDDITYFNNFVLDPHHVQPLSHPPNTVGQSAPPQAYGLQAPPPGQFGPDFRGFERGYPPPPYPYGGYWDPYAHGAYPHPGGFAPYPPPPRDDRGRRLSERVGGFAPSTEGTGLPPAPGLPPKPAPLDSALIAGNGGARRGPIKAATGPLPPPPDAKEDPRAAKRVSYHDMDLVAEGDVELQY